MSSKNGATPKKETPEEPSEKGSDAAAPPPISAGSTDTTAQLTCDVLCSLGSCSPQPDACKEEVCNEKKPRKSGKSCHKQHQLPMFLSKTYHMIDRCDPSVATWSDTGDNFVVKNVEKFAATILPQYFKHSNFASFARQLNFYGFRKLKAEPILTADYDASTACYVRFYHEKFQKDRPELLKDIRRATKSDMQSKDDVESLKTEIAKLKECIQGITADYDRKLAEMSYEYNRRITTLSAEYDRLAMLVQQLLTKHGESIVVPTLPALPPGSVPDLMHSLSQAASLSLQSGLAAAHPPPPSAPAPHAHASGATAVGTKRPAMDETAKEPPAAKSRTS